MNKGLVIYRSKYGATKKYVDMIGEELDCETVEIKNSRDFAREDREWVVLAGGIYAGGIAGLSILRKNCKYLKNHKTAVFCVGASPFDEKAIEEVRTRNFRGDLQNIPVFYGRGAWDESRMTGKDRILCKILQKVIARSDPDSCEPWMKALLASAGETCDWTDRRYLQPLLEYLRT